MDPDPSVKQTPDPTDLRARSSTRERRSLLGHTLSTVCAAVVLAFVGLLLLPTGHANLRALVSVNGVVYAVSTDATISTVASGALALARPGSLLDLTGDVMAIGAGGPVVTRLDKQPSTPNQPLADGAVVQVAHGTNKLEAIYKKDENIPFKTTVQGEGPFVSLARRWA
jgi:hypothetical protein